MWTQSLRNWTLSKLERGYYYHFFSYLDLCLIHWPMGYQEGGELFPKDPESGKILLSDTHFFDTWQALEDAVFKEKINSIGLSNFNAEQVKTIDQNCRIRPAALQVIFVIL